MCNACNFQCCGSDMFGGCGCHCGEPECWAMCEGCGCPDFDCECEDDGCWDHPDDCDCAPRIVEHQNNPLSAILAEALQKANPKE